MAETSGSRSMTLAELTEYKKYIIEIIYRLESENALSLRQTITSEGKTAIALEFRAPEWFRELSEDIQEVAFDNLQRVMVERVSRTTPVLCFCAYMIHIPRPVLSL